MIQQQDGDGPFGSGRPIATDTDMTSEDNVTDNDFSTAPETDDDPEDRAIGTGSNDAYPDQSGIDNDEVDANGELNDYDDGVADDPERIARDRIPPLDSTTPDDISSGGRSHFTGGVPTGSGATGAYSYGSSDDSVDADTTTAGGDAPTLVGSGSNS